MKIYWLIIIAVLTLLPVQGIALDNKAVSDSLMAQLDEVISNRDIYLKEKESRLDSLHRRLESATGHREKFDLLGMLFGEYHPFNADSAYAISIRQEAEAKATGNTSYIMNARMNRANILSATGMYHETLRLIDSIHSHEVPDYLRPYYYHTKRTVYGRLADYAAFPPEKKHYELLTDLYRDSLLGVNAPGSLFHNVIKADQLNVHGRPAEAIEMLQRFMDTNTLSDHDRAICAWTLSESFAKTGDTDSQKIQLLISAISDMKSAVREYVSLRQLALMLYKEGDLDRAYRFLTIAVDDAAKCNARQRIVELNDSYPMINGIYVETVRNQKRSLEHTIFIITILSLVLIGLLFYMRKQMIRIAKARKEVEETNIRLHSLNTQLSDSNHKLYELNNQLTETNEKLNDLNTRLSLSNDKLSEAYSAIAEISELKEVYIGRYMDQCLAYIEKLDEYRKSIGKLLNSGKSDDLKKLVKSSALIDEELKLFYDQFDKTFLNLFPSFVEDFNDLLMPEESIIPKKAGGLNAELRIFALIRLGISDSDKIAKFLRYSLTTIYNYRTKVRNKAKGDRNKLEAEVMNIGRNGQSRP